MDINNIKKELFEVMHSHAKLAAAEYERDKSFNNTHFAHKAETTALIILDALNWTDEFFQYAKENGGIKNLTPTPRSVERKGRERNESNT